MEDAELQRLRADVQGLGEVIKGMERTIAAERRARQIVEADNAGLLQMSSDWDVLTARAFAAHYGEHDTISLAMHSAPHPGAAIVKVLDQVRWAVENHYAPPPLVDAFMEMEKGR